MARAAPGLALLTHLAVCVCEIWSLCPSCYEGPPRSVLSQERTRGPDTGHPPYSPRSPKSNRPPQAPGSPLTPGLSGGTAAPAWQPGSLLGTHMAATPHATLTSSSPLGAPAPPVSSLPGRARPPRPALTSGSLLLPGPLPSPSAHSCPWPPATQSGGDEGGGDSCVSDGGCPFLPLPPSCLSLMTAAQSKGWGLSQLPPQAGIKCLPWLCSGARTIPGGEGSWLGTASGKPTPPGDSLGPAGRSIWSDWGW